MSNRVSPHAEAEIAAIFARLREDVASTAETPARPDDAIDLGDLPSRRELDRRWAVTAEREYLHRPGWWGRLRGALLVVPKAVLRRLMRWYVEPVAADQRAFNAAVLRALDELSGRVETALEDLQRSVTRLEERIARIEDPEAAREAPDEASASRP